MVARQKALVAREAVARHRTCLDVADTDVVAVAAVVVAGGVAGAVCVGCALAHPRDQRQFFYVESVDGDDRRARQGD